MNVRVIEWPKGSGRTATYEKHEYEAIRAMIAEADERGVPRAQISGEISLIHEAKVELGARLLPPYRPDWLPPPDSPFQPPPSVLTDLARDQG